MTNYADCITAQPGAFLAGLDDPPPPTDCIICPEKYIPNVDEAPGRIPLPPPDVNVQSPDIGYPEDITVFIPGDDGVGEATAKFSFTRFSLYDVPSYEGITDHVILEPTQVGLPRSSWRDSVVETEVQVLGDQLLNIPGGISVKITQLPSIGNDTLPQFEIIYPRTPAAQQYYVNNPRGFLSCTFDIAYTADLLNDDPDVGRFEVFRHRVVLGAALNFTGGSVQDPLVNFPPSVDVYFNSTTQPNLVVQANPWDLKGQQVVSHSIETFPPATDYDETITFDPLNGTLMIPTESEVLSNPLIGVRLTLNFSESDTINPTIQINSINDGPVSPPVFSYTNPETGHIDSGVVFYETAAQNPPSNMIVPTEWNFNGNPADLEKFTVYQSRVQQGCGGLGVCWPEENEGGSYANTVHFNPLTGVITLDPWLINPGAIDLSELPGDLSLQFDYIADDPANNVFVSITIPLEYQEFTTLALTGGGPGTTTVMSKNTGRPLVVPSNYSSLKGTGNFNLSKKKNVATGFVGKGILSITPVNLPESDNIIKLKNTQYYDGITSTNFTFYTTHSSAPDLLLGNKDNLDFSVTGSTPKKTIFNSQVDFTVQEIQKINGNPSDYDDFVYNAINSDKVKKSLSQKTRRALSYRYNLDGSKLVDTIATATLQSLIANDGTITEEELDSVVGDSNAKSLRLSSNTAINKVAAANIFLNNSFSLDANNYNILDKNRILNWKVLAEEVDKHIIFKTSEGTETTIYIPNSELITVHTSTGVEHTLEMQDGDYFQANTVTGDDRLTVYSNQKQAVAMSREDLAKASRLAGGSQYMDLTCTSIDTNLVELNVDTTGSRAEYYFLTIDKTTIESSPTDDMYFKSIQATYDYKTSESEINSFIKHKLPYAMITLRSDDIIFNHLESSQKATIEINQFTLDNFTNNSSKILPTRIPWYIIIIPSDKQSMVPVYSRSKMKSFNSRTIRLGLSPIGNTAVDGGEFAGITETITTTEGVNFKPDVVGNTIYQENRKYSLNSTALTNIPKYKNNSEVLPRKVHPTNKLLDKIKDLKSTNSLTTRDKVTFYDLYSRMNPSDFRALESDQFNYDEFLGKLRINKVADTKQINTDNFVKVKEVSIISNRENPEILPDDISTVFSKSKTNAEDAGDPVAAPEDRGGGFFPTP